MGTRFGDWLEDSTWTAATLARALSRRGLRTSRQGVHRWIEGGSPSAARIAALERLTEGEVTARTFEADAVCCCQRLDGGGVAPCCRVHEWNPSPCDHEAAQIA